MHEADSPETFVQRFSASHPRTALYCDISSLTVLCSTCSLSSHLRCEQKAGWWWWWWWWWWWCVELAIALCSLLRRPRLIAGFSSFIPGFKTQRCALNLSRKEPCSAFVLCLWSGSAASVWSVSSVCRTHVFIVVPKTVTLKVWELFDLSVRWVNCAGCPGCYVLYLSDE